MKIKTRLGLAFATQILLATALGIGVPFGVPTVKKRFGVVAEHITPAIVNAKELSKLVVDMETGQRGFCITQKEEYLEPYTTGAKAFDALIEKEKQLYAKVHIHGEDHSGQIETLERIERLVHEWHERAARPEIAMARKVATQVVDAQYLQEVLTRGVGKELMDKIMALGHKLEVSFSDQGDWEGAFAVEIIEKCMADREDGQRGFLITGKEEFLDKYTAGEQKKLPQYFARLRAIVSKRGRGDELSKEVDQLEQLTREWTKKAAEPEIAARREMNKHPESLKDVAALLEADTGKALIDQIRREFDRLIETEEGHATKKYAEACAITRTTRNIAVALLVLATCLGAAVAVATSRAIAVPLAKLVRGVEPLGSGDLQTRIEGESSDEIGQLTHSFNRMADDLTTSMDKLKKEVTERKHMEDEARRLATIAEQTVEGVAVANLEGTIEFANQAWVAMHGYDFAEELLGEPLTIFHTEEQIETEVIPFNEQVKQSGYKIGEIGHKRKDGSTFPTMMVVSLLKDEQGKPYGLAGFAQDITERKQVDEALTTHARQQAEVAGFGQFALAGNSLDDLFDQAVSLISRTLGTKYAGVLEHRPEEGVLFLRAGVGWKEGWVGHKSVPDGAGSQGGYTLLQDKPVIAEDIHNETRFTPPALLTEHNAVGGMTVAIPGADRPFGVLGVHTDRFRHFTQDDAHFLEAVANVLAGAIQQKWAEKQLRRSETKFRALYDSSSDAVMLLDEKGFFDCNDATVRIFGCKDKAEFCSKHPAEVSPPAQPCGTHSMTLANERIAAAMESGSNRFEWMHKRVDTGEPFPAEVLINAMDLDGRQVLQAVVRDITQRKRVEEELEAKVTELEEFSKLAVGRELRMIDLKEEINRLLAEAGAVERYGIAQ